jgi:hypothetical protein
MRDAIDALQVLGAAIIVAYAAIKAARGGINVNVKHEHTPPPTDRDHPHHNDHKP